MLKPDISGFENTVDPDQLAWEASWLESTVFSTFGVICLSLESKNYN